MDCTSKGHWKQKSMVLLPVSKALQMFENSKTSYSIGNSSQLLMITSLELLITNLLIFRGIRVHDGQKGEQEIFQSLGLLRCLSGLAPRRSLQIL